MKRKILFTGLIALLLTTCKKQEGEGGSASVRGKIWVEDWNGGFTIKNGEYAGADEFVYIIYGDDVGYGDRIKTTYTGEFEFKYLRKGNYKIYVFSEDNTLKSLSGDTAFVREVSISSRKQTVDIGQITIYK